MARSIWLPFGSDLTRDLVSQPTWGSGSCITVIYPPAHCLCLLGGHPTPEPPPAQPPSGKGRCQGADTA